jgi:hypothetical protein
MCKIRVIASCIAEKYLTPRQPKKAMANAGKTQFHPQRRSNAGAKREGRASKRDMIDIISLLLSHGLLLVACWRLLSRPDLDDESATTPETPSAPATTQDRASSNA